MNLITDHFVKQEWARYRERQRLRELEKQEKTHVFQHKNTMTKKYPQEQLGVVPSLTNTSKEGEEKQDMYEHKNPIHPFHSPIPKQLQFSPSHATAKLYTPPYNDEDSEDDDIEEYGRRTKPFTPSVNRFNHNIFANTGHHNFLPRHLSPAIIKTIKQSRKQEQDSSASTGGNDFGDYKRQADDDSDDDSLSEKVNQYLNNRRREFGERERKEKNSVKKRKKSLSFLVNQFLNNKKERNSVKKRNNASFGEKYRKDNKSVGRWTYEEKLAFLNGMKQYGIGKWSNIASTIPTRNTMQCKTHGQSMMKRCGEKEDIIKYLEKNLEEFRCKKGFLTKEKSSEHTEATEEASVEVEPPKSSTTTSLSRSTFDDRFEDLQNYKKQHGHLNVTSLEDSVLYSWICKIKVSYHEMKSNPTAKPTYSARSMFSLNEEKIERLKEIGFDFGKDGIDETRKEEMSSFQKNIAKLKEFRKVHGHCNISKNHSDQTLYCWTQRMGLSYRFIQDGKKPPYNLQPDEIKQLTDLDFDFRKSKKKSWDIWFMQLEEYKRRHGHVNVKNTKEDNPLYMWCYRMNYAYNERKRNIKPRHSSLSQEREQKLKDIGFKFYEVKAKPKTLEKSFDEWFAELETFKTSHGHIEVPCSHEYRYLHQWCLDMKKLCEEIKRGKTPPGDKVDEEEIEKLEDIGFFKIDTLKEGSDDEKDLVPLDENTEFAKGSDDEMKPVPLNEDTEFGKGSDNEKEPVPLDDDIETAKGSDDKMKPIPLDEDTEFAKGYDDEMKPVQFD
ncbi:hypothetical protein CTEN210_12661 [Chaetoceros tenuissimus]|uniref:Myb-like domain-containing protein n=1 Tax=Chaetoceros tenuissimus TaxID=426638 RepID=A0AAD3D456_9STRA|nr:hypothetical protein CTEN210_12661 [Chaetoceros tenuissimus]